MSVPKRKYLVDALNEAFPELHKAFCRQGGEGNLVIFLQSAIMRDSDDAALERILADIHQELDEIAQRQLTPSSA